MSDSLTLEDVKAGYEQSQLEPQELPKPVPNFASTAIATGPEDNFKKELTQQVFIKAVGKPREEVLEAVRNDPDLRSTALKETADRLEKSSATVRKRLQEAQLVPKQEQQQEE